MNTRDNVTIPLIYNSVHWHRVFSYVRLWVLRAMLAYCILYLRTLRLNCIAEIHAEQMIT